MFNAGRFHGFVRFFLLVGLVMMLVAASMPGSSAAALSEAGRDSSSAALVRSYRVESPYQAGPTEIRVLLPEPLEPGRCYPVVYLLPVEAGREHRYGDAVAEVVRRKLHEKYAAIFVAPTFSALPWYADHPTRRELRQESHFLKVVVPFVEKHFPASPRAEDRLLLGFSKSGFGAWSLLLRHPEMFGRAVAWDAPLMMQQSGKYGSGPVFGTQENFEHYKVADLVKAKAEKLRGTARLILIGYGNFRSHHQQMHRLLDQLHIPHVYRDGPARKHDWHSGWVSEAVALLLKPRPAGCPTRQIQ